VRATRQAVALGSLQRKTYPMFSGDSVVFLNHRFARHAFHDHVDVARLEKIASRNPAGNARDSQRRASLPLAWALVK